MPSDEMPERIWAFEDYPGQGAVPRSGMWCDEQSETPDGSPCFIRSDLCASGSATPTAQEPVAWRCKDYADDWIVYGNKAQAELYQACTGCLMEALYVHPPQPAGEAVLVSQDVLIDLIGELGREVFHLLDDCETSGPVGEEVHTITDESLTKVSAILDRIEALPFEEPGVILGVGAMLQAAIKQTFQTHPPQPSETVAEPRVICLPYPMHGYGVCVGGRYDGWLMWQHPDGQWVTKANLESVDPRALKGDV